jgi:phospholipid/cholesterol/gamma-HCH transport system permease protein
MTGTKTLSTIGYDTHEGKDGSIILKMKGRMDASNSAPLLREVEALFKGKRPSSVTVDMEGVTSLDDFGALILVELRQRVTQNHGQFRVEKANEKVEKMLSLLQVDSVGKRATFIKKRGPNTFERLGEASLELASDIQYMLSFIGSICFAMVHVIIHPKALRWDDTLSYMQRVGVDALPIVALISFLLGLIMAFMSAVQLEQFGANIYVASLVSLAMTRELGPIMTSIIVAGRSGSAFAAEIGTMKISEEIDALYTMGFDPTRFLVIPKLLAALIVVPFLTLFSDVFAIIGGLVVGVAMLDLTVNSYMAQTIKTLTLFDVFLGFMKSAVFAMLIAWIGCLRGFQVKGGAASVGQATTSAVVSSIFLIIVADSVFSVILRYWG